MQHQTPRSSVARPEQRTPNRERLHSKFCTVPIGPLSTQKDERSRESRLVCYRHLAVRKTVLSSNLCDSARESQLRAAIQSAHNFHFPQPVQLTDADSKRF